MTDTDARRDVVLIAARLRGLECQTRGEEPLDGAVVEITRDAFSVFDDTEILFGLTQTFVGLEALADITHDLDVGPRPTIVVASRFESDLDG